MSTTPPWGDPRSAPHPQQYQQGPGHGGPGFEQNVLRCPKCGGTMRTYERNRVHIDQCDTCRGIFLDFGELEALLRIESQYTPAPPAPAPHAYPQPGWGHHGGHHYHKKGIGGLFFSS